MSAGTPTTWSREPEVGDAEEACSRRHVARLPTGVVGVRHIDELLLIAKRGILGRACQPVSDEMLHKRGAEGPGVALEGHLHGRRQDYS